MHKKIKKIQFPKIISNYSIISIITCRAILYQCYGHSHLCLHFFERGKGVEYVYNSQPDLNIKLTIVNTNK